MGAGDPFGASCRAFSFEGCKFPGMIWGGNFSIWLWLPRIGIEKKNIYLSKYIHQQLNIKTSCSLTAYFIVLLNRKVPRFLPFMYKVLTVLILRSHARIQCFPELIRSSWEDQVIVYPTISTVLSQDKDLNFLLLTSCLFQVLIYPTRSSKPMNFYRWQVFLQIRTCSST